MRAALSFSGCHRRAGVERIMLECALFLASRGHDIDVFAHDYDPSEAPSLNFHYVPMRKQPFFLRDRSFFQECTRRLDSRSYDVMGTFGSVCPVGGVHFVQSIHRAWLERSRLLRAPLSPAGIGQRLNPLHHVLLELEEYHFRQRRYRKIIATTPQIRDDLKRLYDVPEEDVVIIPNGFSPTEFSPERRATRRLEARTHLGLQPEHVVLLFAANELERKGYGTILSALSQLRRPELRLLVVGKPDVAIVRRRAAQAGLAEQVIACGQTRDVEFYHAASDLFVLPTQYEAYCLAILEALGSGLPVVTTRVPGAQDAIQPGINGALIDDPRDGKQLAAALEPLLEEGPRTALSARVPETAREYQWPVVLKRYEQLLLECRN